MLQKAIKLAVLLLLTVAGLHAQTFHRENVLQNQNGQGIISASIYVCVPGSVPNFSATPPCTLATVYSNLAGDLPISQPIFSGPLGNYDYFVSPSLGTVVEAISGPGFSPISDIVTLGGPGGSTPGFEFLTANTDWTQTPGNLMTNTDSPAVIALTDPDGVSEVVMSVDGDNTDSTYLFVQAINNNPSPTAPSGGETNPFGSWAWIGGPQNTVSGSGGGCFFYPPSNPPNCGASAWFIAGDLPTDTNSGQDLVTVYSQLQLTKGAGLNIHKGVGFFIAPPGNCFLSGSIECSTTGIPAETAGTLYGIEIADQRGVTTSDGAAIKIDAQTAPASGTQYAIEVAPGGGLTQLQDLNAASVTAGAGISVGSLPSASLNAGKLIYVTDSTSVASEGQTCTGGSSNKALAFSNGSVWKCF